MSTKTCLKCQFKTAYEGTPPMACPSCGAVYAKVEAAFRDQPHPSHARAVRRNQQTPFVDVQDFADQMRSESLYPAFRTVVKFIYVFGLVLAAVTLLASLFLAAQTGPSAAIGGLIGACVMCLFFKVSKEVSLMVADLSDASVRLAATADKNNR